MATGRYVNEARTIYTVRRAPDTWHVYIGKLTWTGNDYAGSITKSARDQSTGEMMWTTVRSDGYMTRTYGTRQDAALKVAGR